MNPLSYKELAARNKNKIKSDFFYSDDFKIKVKNKTLVSKLLPGQSNKAKKILALFLYEEPSC